MMATHLNLHHHHRACSGAAASNSCRNGHLAVPRLRNRTPPPACSAAAASSSGRPSGTPSSGASLELDSFLQLYKQKSRGQPQPSGPGEVFLIGTGPGDPGLLTLRAVQFMQRADVVLYDRLVSDEILQLVHPGACMVYVGKQAGYHTRTQQEIHDLLVAFAGAGATVVRLKGGDPYVFGRGGEEVQHLAANGIRVHCVPGITAASGICAELGIPMTHRGIATSVRFLTGHAREGGEEALDAAISVAADPHTTLVVYMGLGTLPGLTAQLASGGMPASLPAVAVERGTTPGRRIVFGPVSELPARTSAARLRSPTLVVIGEVVALAPGWGVWDAAGRPLEWNDAYEFPDMPGLQAFAALAAPAASELPARPAGAGWEAVAA